jgi:hypothetical protein
VQLSDGFNAQNAANSLWALATALATLEVEDADIIDAFVNACVDRVRGILKTQVEKCEICIK